MYRFISLVIVFHKIWANCKTQLMASMFNTILHTVYTVRDKASRKSLDKKKKKKKKLQRDAIADISCLAKNIFEIIDVCEICS